MPNEKYRSSERELASNSIASAQVISLDAHAERGYRATPYVPPGSKPVKPRPGHPCGREFGAAASVARRGFAAHDLQNVLNGTEVATILLDADLHIRFFTPATKLVFNVMPGDVGRPLTDLSSLAGDATLVSDARQVLQQSKPIEREIETQGGAWNVRRILPYRSPGKANEGLIITFADITRQKQAVAALEQARIRADCANAAKSRLLAAANHDLRQPLQMLVLLQELLARIVVGDRARQLVGQLDQALEGMCGILNALVDGNQVEPARQSIEPGCSAAAAPGSAPVVCVVDDDRAVREAIRSLLEQHGHHVEDFADGEAFLDAYRPGRHGCVLIDAHLPGISGLDLLRRLQDDGHLLPAIIIAGQSDVPMAVEAMKAGAADFLQKPVRGAELLEGIARALEVSRESAKLLRSRQQAADHLAGLTRRQHQIMALVLAGHPSKNIAADLGISQRTVENHRASIMKKSGTRSLPALARLALAAADDSHDRPTA